MHAFEVVLLLLAHCPIGFDPAWLSGLRVCDDDGVSHAEGPRLSALPIARGAVRDRDRPHVRHPSASPYMVAADA